MSADRGYIQAQEFAERTAVLRDALSQAGRVGPDRQAEVLLYRVVNYEADNLVFAEIYATFAVVAICLAVLCLGLLIWDWMRPPPRPRPHDRHRDWPPRRTRADRANRASRSQCLDPLVVQA